VIADRLAEHAASGCGEQSDPRLSESSLTDCSNQDISFTVAVEIFGYWALSAERFLLGRRSDRRAESAGSIV